MPVNIPQHYKETSISKPNAIGGGIAEASTKATSYITQIDDAGITIHPNGGTTSRLQVNASGTTVYQNNEDVAFYGATTRIGKANADRVEIDPTNGITLYKGTAKRFGTTDAGIALFGAGDQTNPVVKIEGQVGSGGNYASGTLAFYKNVYQIQASTGYLQFRTGANINWLSQGHTINLDFPTYYLNRASIYDVGDVHITGTADVPSYLSLDEHSMLEFDHNPCYITYGSVGQTNSVPANSYIDITEYFGHTYADTPIVLVSLYSTSTSSEVGNISCAVTSGATDHVVIRVFNAGSTSRKPGIRWVAIGG